MNTRKRVVVAMSGGVDSSVAAALLLQQGFQVTGMMMRLWSEPGAEAENRCCTPDAMAQARRVAAILGIPFYAVDARQVFYDQVVTRFLDGFEQGATPNPCVFCNRQVRWGFLFEHALGYGADFMATGHYARLLHQADGAFRLCRGLDANKDQSYVLHVLTQAQLSHALFPLGEYTKPQIRQFARDFNLPVAERPDSQDLCFLGDGDYRQFLQRHAPEMIQPGAIRNSRGELLGAHQGLAFYTIGQRKGLGLAAPDPQYVLAKDPASNTLLVGGKEELGKSKFTVGEINWLAGHAPQAGSRLGVKIRYKAPEAWAVVTPVGQSQAVVSLEEPLRDITPGQSAVFYTDDCCLGGGIIEAFSIE